MNDHNQRQLKLQQTLLTNGGIFAAAGNHTPPGAVKRARAEANNSLEEHAEGLHTRSSCVVECGLTAKRVRDWRGDGPMRKILVFALFPAILLVAACSDNAQPQPVPTVTTAAASCPEVVVVGDLEVPGSAGAAPADELLPPGIPDAVRVCTYEGNTGDEDGTSRALSAEYTLSQAETAIVPTIGTGSSGRALSCDDVRQAVTEVLISVHYGADTIWVAGATVCSPTYTDSFQTTTLQVQKGIEELVKLADKVNS